MKKTTLALPAGSPFADAFVSEARVAGREPVLCSVGPAPAKGDEAPGGAIPWNPLSFASARTVILEAENALEGSLDEVVIFADPPADSRRLVDAAPRDIETAALAWAAGHAHLVREAMRRFSERRGGTVFLILLDRPGRGALGSMAASALAGLAEGLLSEPEAPYRFLFARDESAQPELLARFAAKTLDAPPRDAARVLRHGGRPSIFGR